MSNINSELVAELSMAGLVPQPDQVMQPETSVTPPPITDKCGHTAYAIGYSAVGHGPGHLQRVCKWVVEHLPRVMRETGADSVVVRGTSGLSVAFGMIAMGLDSYPLVMLRKRHEQSHGQHKQLLNPKRGDGHVVSKYVILDDFTATGGTMLGIQDDLPDADCVGILLYNGCDMHADTCEITTVTYPRHNARGVSCPHYGIPGY